MSTQKTGLLLAVAFAMIASGVVLFFIMRHKSEGNAPTPSQLGVPQPPSSAAAGTAHGEMGATQWAHIQFVDRKSPARIAGEMLWLSLEPLEQRGRSVVTDPLFWIYPEGGKAIRIQARQARIFQPDQQSEPESGRLEGGVPVSIYAGRPPGAGTERPIQVPSELLWHTPGSLAFDSVLGEISTMDEWTAVTRQIEAQGNGLRVQVNQLRNRLELLEVDRGGVIRSVRPDAEPTDPRPASRGPAPSPTPAASQAPAIEQPARHEEVYYATFSGDVKIHHRGRLIEGDTLQVWLRTIDGSLPPGAIGGADRGDRGGNAAHPPGLTLMSHILSATVAALPTLPQDGAPANADNSGDAITLTWSGTLVVRPINNAAENPPKELAAGNHVALRMTADRTGWVAFTDTDSGLKGRCAWVEYLATTQDLTLSGPGPNAVTFTTRDNQQATVGRFELNLGTGLGAVPGAGVLEDGLQRITWNDRADLVLAVRDGSITGELREAAFTGRVLASSGDEPERQAKVRGDFLRATFLCEPGEPNTLSQVHVEGNAVAQVGPGSDNMLRADRLTLAFQPPAAGKGDPAPSLLTAIGNVLVRRGQRQLNADFLESGLERNADGQTIATDVLARGGPGGERVRITGEDGLSASADELQAHAPMEHAQLIALPGREASVARAGSRIFGPTLQLDGLQGQIICWGPGRFEHTSPGGQGGGLTHGGPIRRLEARWSTAMQFDDVAGTLDSTGEVVAATSDPAGMMVDIARGHHLHLAMTPGRGRSIADGRPPAAGEDERRLLLAEVWGDEMSEAVVESRRFVEDAGAEGGRRLERFMRLTGSRIIADEVDGTLSVPGAGRAAMYDGRWIAHGSPAQEPTDLLEGRGFRGSALFIWRGGMSLERATGLLAMRRSVQLVHRTLNDTEPPTTLECERLDAQLRARDGSAAGAAISLEQGAGAELVWARARDAVYIESGSRKLVGDEVHYDAAAGTALATAGEGNRVTLYDEARGTTLPARKLLWDLRRDVITVQEPTPIITPIVAPTK